MIEEQEKNDIDDNNENNIINNNENESSYEILNGGEEDEDDLLKSETETNKSANEEISKKNKNDIVKQLEELDKKELELAMKLREVKKESDDNNNNISGMRINILKDTFTNIGFREESSDDKKEEKNDDKKKESKEGETVEEEEEEEEEENDNDTDEFGDTTETKKDPYESYLNSQTSFTNYFSHLKEGDYIYGLKTKIFYLYFTKLPPKRNISLFIKAQNDEEIKVMEILKNINDRFQQGTQSKEMERTNKKNLFNYIRDKVKREEIILIQRNSINDFTFNKKIRIHYLNYLKKKHTFEIPININWKLRQFIYYFKNLYHIPDASNNSNLIIYVKERKYSGKDIEKSEQKIFSPKIFDYEKDYIFIIEHENFELISIDLGSSIDKYNFKGKQIPHIIFSPHYNLCIESLLISNQIKSLECEVYVFRDEFYFNIKSNVGTNNYEEAKNVLTNFNWKNKCKFVTTIRSAKSSQYKNNDDVLSFSICPKFNLYHDKTYIFLISTPLMKINVFNSGEGDQELFIISSDNKCIINGIKCKKLSDFSLDN